MKAVILPGKIGGTVQAIPSKSHVHRLLICAALSGQEVFVPCSGTSDDIGATAACLAGLGAAAESVPGGWLVRGGRAPAGTFPCGESGTTYRLLAPIACALGIESRFSLAGRLPERPMEHLWQAMESHGAAVFGKGSSCVEICGRLTSGTYELPGDVSSQYISALLFALPLIEGESVLRINGTMQSAGYVRMTLNALSQFGIRIEETAYGFKIPGGQKYVSPNKLASDGDWSGAAFWLCAGACVPEGITVTGLSMESTQGDKEICSVLSQFGAHVSADGDAVTVKPGKLCGITVDAGNIPDLVPAIALAAAAADGETVIENAGRLRLKESDRLATVCATVTDLGGAAFIDGDRLVITGCGSLRGGEASSFGDHRIAMLAAAASVICTAPVTVKGAQAVSKSYPGFFDDFKQLGGKAELSADCI